MASIGNRLFLSWYAVREKQAGLSISWSDDGGKTFSKRVNIAENVIDPNHPTMLVTGDKISVVFQGRDASAGDGWGPVNAYYREINAEGQLSPLERLGYDAGSASYPTFAFEEPGRFFVVWTEPNKDAKSIVMVRGRR